MKCPDCGTANLPGEELCVSCHASLSALATPQPKGGMQRRILSGTVGDLRVHEALTVEETESVAQAVRSMRKHKTGCVLATNGGALSGIFTERDLLLNLPPGEDPSLIPVARAMRRDPDCVGEEQPIAFAFHKMSVQGHYHLPVRTKSGGLGVVSARDLLAYLCS